MPEKNIYSQIIDLSFHLEELEKKEHMKFKTSRRKEKIKIRGKLKEIENLKERKSMKSIASFLRISAKLMNLEGD